MKVQRELKTFLEAGLPQIKMADNPPVRSFMDDPDIEWKFGHKPDFTLTDLKYMSERSKHHKPDSLEKIVENLVKTWEMESTHKINIKVNQPQPSSSV